LPRLWWLSRRAVTETRTVSVPVRVPSHPGLVKHGRMTDRVSSANCRQRSLGRSAAMRPHGQAVCKTVGFAFPGSNPGPATNTGKAPGPRVCGRALASPGPEDSRRYPAIRPAGQAQMGWWTWMPSSGTVTWSSAVRSARTPRQHAGPDRASWWPAVASAAWMSWGS
jgi:hypothetical protein